MNDFRVKVSAVDGDGTSKITYSLNDTDDFVINSRGVIMTAAVLDGDEEAFYNTTVTACDSEGLCSDAKISVCMG